MGAAAQVTPDQRVAQFRKVFSHAETQISRVIVGHQDVIRKLLTALFARPHFDRGVPDSAKRCW